MLRAATSMTNSLGSTGIRLTCISSTNSISLVTPAEPVMGTLLGFCSTVIFPTPVPYKAAFKSISYIP